MSNAYETPVSATTRSLDASGFDGAGASAVSWAAIFAGAVGAAAITLLLITLSTGLGFASVSPFGNSGVSASTFTIITAVWLIVVHALASGIGGYLAGRLRTKWVGVHTDEVYFRDTAHGFVSWALGTLMGALLLTSVASSILGAGAQAGATLASGAAQGAMTGMAASVAGSSGATSSPADPTSYFVDMLFRSDRPAPDANDAAVRTEVGRIIANAIRTGELPPADKTYVAQVISAKTGVPQPEAEKRIDDTLAKAKQASATAADKAKQAADAARKAASYASLWMAAAMLIGAFCASISATWGGRSRDS